MNQFYFIYGNQSLELEEETENLIQRITENKKKEHSVYQYNTVDFVKNDQKKSKDLLSDLINTCQMVSFFPETIIICLKDLQDLPKKKNPAEGIIKALHDINLVKIDIKGQQRWADEASLKAPVQSHQHISGNLLVSRAVHLGGNRFYLEIIPAFDHRLIYLERNNEYEAIELNEYFKSKLKKEIFFILPEEDTLINETSNIELTRKLGELLQDPPDHVFFIFSANIKNTKEINTELYKTLQNKVKEIKKTVAYDDFHPVGWLITRTKAKNLKIDRDTADLFIEIVGSDFFNLDHELEKLSIYLKPGSEITPEVLFNELSHSKRFHIFRINEFISQRNIKNTLEFLEEMIGSQPSDAIAIFGVLSSHFRKLLKISWLVTTGMKDREIIQKLKLHPFLGKIIAGQAQKFTTQELENILVHLAKNDIKIKYNKSEALMMLENLCIMICRGDFKLKKHLEHTWLPDP